MEIICSWKGSQCFTALAHTPATLNPTFTAELLSHIDTLNVCIGNPDHRFSALCEMYGGEFKAADGTIASFKDNYYPIKFEDEIYQSTIRSTKCSILTENTKCEVCKNYRATFLAQLKTPYLSEQMCQVTQIIAT